MRRRLGRALVLGAVIAVLVAVQGAPVGAGLGDEEDDDPVGYSIGFTGRGFPASCNFYRINLHTGDATQVNTTPVACGDGLTFDDDGTLYTFVSNGPATQLVTIDRKTGAQHVVGELPRVIIGGGGMTFDADGHLWLYGLTAGAPPCAGDYCLWKVDPDNAQSTFVGTGPATRGVFGLAADCEDVITITASSIPAGPGTPQVRLDEVHTSNAALEKIVDLPGVTFPTGLNFDRDGDLWALGDSDAAGSGIGPTLYRIDPTDGTAQAKDVTISGAPATGVFAGLAASPIDCEDPGPEPVPPAPPTPAAIVVEPVFTG